MKSTRSKEGVREILQLQLKLLRRFEEDTRGDPEEERTEGCCTNDSRQIHAPARAS